MTFTFALAITLKTLWQCGARCLMNANRHSLGTTDKVEASIAADPSDDDKERIKEICGVA